MALFGKRNERIVLYFSPLSLHIALLSSQSKISLSRLLYFQSYSFNHFEYHAGVIYNQAYLLHTIENFVHTNKIVCKEVDIILAPGCMREEVMALPKMVITKHDIPFSDRMSCIWQFQYLYPHDELGHLFYISALYPWNFYQYQQLINELKLSLCSLSSATSAHLAAYKAWYGVAYRSSQLVIDVKNTQASLGEFFNKERLYRLIEVDRAIAINSGEQQNILAAFAGVYHKENV